MNDGQEELIKAGAAEIARPFQELLLKLLGPAFDEVGGFFGDFFKHYRRKYAVMLFQRVQEVIAEAYIEAKPVPPKLLHNILEHASLESEDELRERWAFLLANASDSRKTHPMPIAFSEILKELSSREVRFLEAWYKNAQKRQPELPAEGFSSLLFEREALLVLYAREGLATDDKFFAYKPGAHTGAKLRETVENWQVFFVLMDILERNRIAMRYMAPDSEKRPSAALAEAAGPKLIFVEHYYLLTNLGIAFVQACIKPI
jgi:hypothetical protein